MVLLLVFFASEAYSDIFPLAGYFESEFAAVSKSNSAVAALFEIHSISFP